MASVTLSALSRSGHARPLATPIGTELLVPAAARGRGKRPVPSITGKRRPYCSFVGAAASQPSAPGVSGSLFTLSEMILLSCITCWLKAA